MKSYDAYARKGKTTGYAGGYLLNLLFASTMGDCSKRGAKPLHECFRHFHDTVQRNLQQ